MGHAAVAYLLYRTSIRLRGGDTPAHVPTWIVIVGGLFPDLVDKPLAWYLGVLPTGRTLAHSLLTLSLLSIGLYLLARRYDRGEYGIAFAIGAISHALVDAFPALWRPDADVSFLLWPLLPVETYESGAPTVLGLLAGSLTDPYFLFEFVLFGFAVVCWWRDGSPGLRPINELLHRYGVGARRRTED